MKGKMAFGALLLSAALSSQGFGFELLANMVGLNRGGGQCGESACCDQAADCCAPEACCEPASCETCGKSRDLFSGLKGLFACKSCRRPTCCEDAESCAPEPACCEEACSEPQCCKTRSKRRCAKPKCCDEPQCCEEACAEPECCEPACKSRCRSRGPLECMLDDLYCHAKRCVKRCVKPKCCEQACGEPTCCKTRSKRRCCKPKGCCEPAGCGGGGGGEATEEGAPLPIAPAADPSASLWQSRNIHETARSIVSR